MYNICEFSLQLSPFRILSLVTFIFPTHVQQPSITLHFECRTSADASTYSIAAPHADRFDNYAAFPAVAEPGVVHDKVLVIHSPVALAITSPPDDAGDDDVSCSCSSKQQASA